MEQFHERYGRLLERATGAGLVRDARLVRLPGNVPPWTDTGFEVDAGDEITLLAAGRIVWAEELGLWAGPRYSLWGRIGEHGTIFNPTRDTFSLAVPSPGRLHLAIYQGEWATRDGKLATPVEAYAALGGAIDVVVIRWVTDARTGLESLARLAPDDPLVATEIARMRSPAIRPEGWDYLWFLGASEIFRAEGRSIAVRAESDVGILQKPVAADLGPDTTISWRWKIERLPATEPENSFPTHDYLSIATEFENGKDLTWYWSAALPPGTCYTCPLPTWAERETHLVIRSGADGLGAWQSERRNVFDDYRAGIGEPPRRIVAVWLIAVSIFRHGLGLAEFADIAIESGGRRIPVL